MHFWTVNREDLGTRLRFQTITNVFDNSKPWFWTLLHLMHQDRQQLFHFLKGNLRCLLRLSFNPEILINIFLALSISIVSYGTSSNKRLIFVVSVDGLVMSKSNRNAGSYDYHLSLDDNFHALNHSIKSILFFCFQFFLQFHFQLTPNQIQQQQQKRGGASQQSLPPGLAPPPPRNIPSANPLNPFAQRWLLVKIYTFSQNILRSMYKPS